MIGLIANPIIYYVLSESLLFPKFIFCIPCLFITCGITHLVCLWVLTSADRKSGVYDSNDNGFDEFKGSLICRIWCLPSYGSTLCRVLVI